MIRGRVGRADLIKAIGLQTAEPARAAALVGYEPRLDSSTEIEPEDRPDEPSPQRAATTDEATSWQPPVADARSQIKLRTWRVVGYERLKPPPDQRRQIHARPALPQPTCPPPVIAPLAPARSLLARLRRIWQKPFARGIDVDAAIDRISLGEILMDLPQQRQRKWGSRLWIIADRSERLVPYWADQDYLAGALLSLFPSEGVRIDVVSEIDDRAIAEDDESELRPDSHLLVLGDLGALERRREGVDRKWIAFGNRVRRLGGWPLALVPCSDSYLPPELQDVWQVIPWEPHKPVDEPDDEQEPVDVLRLLQVLLSKAIRLEPGLVRQVRRILPAGYSDTALESLFWQDDALIGTSELAATWHPQAAVRLREQFDGPFHPQADRLRPQALRILETWRSHLPAEIFFEEMLGLASDPAVIASLGWNKKYEQALDYFRWLRQDPTTLTPGGTAVDWFCRLEQRLSPGTWESSPIAEELAQLWGMAHQDEPRATPPAYLKTVDFEQTRALPEQTAVICEGAEGLTVQLDRSASVPLAMMTSTQHDSAPPPQRAVARIATRNALLTAEAPFWKHGPGPAFARRVGRDEYGPFFDFEIETDDGPPVVQRMRWIPAGRFLMGSPVTEEARYDHEGPQHEVTISRGFWMFDTQCTQQLWSAVLGKNPSRFHGDQRPVEQVSWLDAQKFTGTLHARIGLESSLPSEAQWEYACRAGTTTPYYFGETLTRNDARFAADSETGTADVKSFQPNAWGLFDMHGNVWEWCQDGWRDYAGEPQFDPLGNVEVGADRVFRGGSWSDRARIVRAAVRFADDPGGRSSVLGFRCVWVQSAAEPVETVSSDDAERGAEPSRNGGAIAIRAEKQAREFHLPQARQIVVRSDCERLLLDALEKPAWAAGFGRDRYGLWADLTLQYETGTKVAKGLKFWIFDFSRVSKTTQVKTVTQRLRWISPGQMLMGSPEGEAGRYEREGPQHPVTISRGFWLFDAPCSQEFWQAVMGENPSRFKDPLRPVVSIDWHQATEFCRRLAQQVPELAFRLPTEAQWEYACRAGTNSAIYTGGLKILGDANAPDLDPIAWYGGNSGVEYDLDEGEALGYLTDKQYPADKSGTRKIKLKKPNPWGLYDMLGNVWEWCHDGLREYSGDAVTDPMGPDDKAAGRVVRGGSWSDHARFVRAASRVANDPGLRDDDLGFRCVCVQSPNGVSASSGRSRDETDRRRDERSEARDAN